MRVVYRATIGLLVLFLLSTGAGAQSSEASTDHVYRCTLSNGQVQFTNKECPPGSQSKIVTGYETQTSKPVEPNENDLTTHNHYINRQGETVHSPSQTISGGVPTGASAVCRDGTYSFSRSRSGTCSHHGGVAQWL